ncbi:hypothetical protein [Tropicimonas sediminicola]|uniref:hypothetical protein n=1 Tax=Tropicimonas sediminicola TaxID=1031541 RepID=UPI001594E9FE|nr:hypothetical protein [Tropicimonas sediminicola]
MKPIEGNNNRSQTYRAETILGGAFYTRENRWRERRNCLERIIVILELLKHASPALSLNQTFRTQKPDGAVIEAVSAHFCATAVFARFCTLADRSQDWLRLSKAKLQKHRQ